ncbi:PrpF domain-containing protein [Ferrovibrio sp.]|uniref:2-methylaconitate cis-trans isomerase PrpF family protein n=1 Tax=Ferrovibrio sp. TaxID=1917215 RepID=UPI001B43E07E|nr:PrpF domain-containing protein [Ferrovibrio sp.]MBP7063628.1 PrpF family protein [Ferrovibrio sp.]
MQHRLKAVFMRGGTSKALIFHQADLPAQRDDWAAIFLAALGSPDPNGRQLDGMGGGVSSLSKICIIGPPSRPDADIDYTFAQVSVDQAMVDYAGNCGNMSSAVGPFAVDEGIIPAPADGLASVRIHNTNTSKIIIATFPVRGGMAVVQGDCEIDGVAGSGAPIRLDFLNPGGSKTGRLLPSGKAIDRLILPDGSPIEASLIDAANPGVFVRAADLGLSGTEAPQALEKDAVLMQRLEMIRLAASVAMGLTPDLAAAARMPSIPKIAAIAPSQAFTALSGRVYAAEDADILVRMISVGQPHRAVPITGGLCLAAACRVPGSLAQQMLRPGQSGALRVGHPSGLLLVDAAAEIQDGAVHVPQASLYRTARRLFQGEVLFRL